MPNELVKGAHRVGNFIDFYPETPLVQVALERSDRGISVTIPWADSDGTHAQWFMKNIGIVQIPAPPEPLPIPRCVLFHDSHGPVLLIRCRPSGFHSNLSGPGSGKLWARAAILGPRGDVEFDRPHGLRTDISGLRDWLGVTSRAEVQEVSEGVRSITLTVKSQPDIEVGEHGGLELAFHPSWQILSEDGGDRRVVDDLLRCETRSREPIEWSEHLQVHRAIRDLLVLSRWRAESCVEVFALRNDDPSLAFNESRRGVDWRDVVVPDDERTPAPSGYWPHLIRYDDLLEAGILRWLAMRDAFSRALDPVISSVALPGATPNTLLAHTGPGLEALGYLLMLRDGMEEKAAAKVTLQARFERIVQDLGDCLPFDGPTWAQDTVVAYNGLKHANRAAPDEVDVMNAWADSVMVVRAWVAVELGVPVEEVKERLSSDRQPRGYEAVE